MDMYTGMIIHGYPCIGKSSVGGMHHCIDLESSTFYDAETKTDSKWYEKYCNVAIDLAKQGYIVFMSTHREVVDYMQAHAANLKLNNIEGPYIIFPSKDLKYSWIIKAHNRFMVDQSNKNYRSFERMAAHFEEDIDYLSSFAKNHLVILENNDYNLIDIIIELKLWKGYLNKYV